MGADYEFRREDDEYDELDLLRVDEDEDSRREVDEAADRDLLRVSEVFVTADPEYTYSSRKSSKLEDDVRDHIEERDKLLFITGPTKTGKTVLVEHVVPSETAHWIKVEGPTVTNPDDVWRQVVDDLGYFTDVAREATRKRTDGVSSRARLELDAKVIRAGLDKGVTGGDETTATKSHSSSRAPHTVARDALLKTGATLVIDDFHHIAPDMQTQLVRQLKSVVEKRRAPVILIAVPHHAADVVRAMPEMQGRLKHVKVPIWTTLELAEIALLGFEVLNVTCSNEISRRLAEFAWGSPHLMQVLCRELAKENGIRQTERTTVAIEEPPSWATFLRGVAVENTDAKTLERLATGARPRTRRKERNLVRGGTTDLYRAVLEAVASTGPKRSLSYSEMRDALQTVLTDLPQSNEITEVLKRLSDIAAADATDAYGRPNDPVLEYDSVDKVLHIVDPFFAFRVRWGPSMAGDG